MAHHHEDTPTQSFDKSEIGFREMVYLWFFGLVAAGAITLSFLYFSSLENFPAPPFMVAMLVGLGTAFVLAVGNLIIRWLLSLDD